MNNIVRLNTLTEFAPRGESMQFNAPFVDVVYGLVYGITRDFKIAAADVNAAANNPSGYGTNAP